ncbi:MAG: DEAD/DEAH box helicase, partial [Clostridiales bacterium]|nr:DEAD/DEAH box helicase [Clostridiales bacterium]
MDNPLSLFSPETARWFAESVGRPTAVQRDGWPAIAGGGDALVSAPTGTGKTLTAFLWFIDRLNTEAQSNGLPDELRVLYISPLKSLANDIRENLDRPLSGLAAPIRTAVRNGDTPPADRAKMARRPPHLLLTTPESLYLLLTAESGRRMLATVRAVVIDELHALIGTKRGTHLMLSLERLDALAGRRVQRIGLSATIRPLQLAARYLSGGGGQAQIVAPDIEKAIDIRVCAAPPDLRMLPERSVWPEISAAVLHLAERARTVLVFCEGRTTAEKVAMGVNAAAGADIARTHHGSLSKERRLEAERMLRAGELKVLCATSSMELGIDVGEVDVVVQVGCPQRIMSAVQRLGRAGHRPGQVSRMIFYPRTHQDLMLQSFTAQAARDRAIEAAHPPECPLDVLAQHLVSMAAAGGFSVAEGWALIRRCYPYRELSLSRLRQVLAMLAGDYEHADDRPVSPRVHYDRIGGLVSAAPGSRLLALSSGGTIPDRGLYAVVLEDGFTRLGELDEEYVFEARLGDSFMLGTFAWRIVAIERDRVIVRPAPRVNAQLPFWKGDGMDRDYETGQRLGRGYAALNEAHAAGRLERTFLTLTGDADAAANAARYAGEQILAVGMLPTHRVMIAEHFRDESGDHLMMVHSIFGGRVNRGLAMLMKDELERRTGGDVRTWFDDDGILIHLTGGGEIPAHLLTAIDPASA